MRRVVACGLTLTLGLILTACLPVIPTQTISNTPVIVDSVDLQATTATMTAAFTQTPKTTPTATLLPTSTFTPIPSLTPTNATPAGTQNLTATPSAMATMTTTLGEAISIDKLPKNTVYGTIRVQNKSGTQVDISLHCTTHQGLQTILEYNNIKSIFVRAPEGNYIYVVYVGGRKLVGSFSFFNTNIMTIIVYRDSVLTH